MIELDKIRKNLKTPLVSICGASEFLLNHCQRLYDEDAKSLIESIHRGGERLNELVKNLIDVSKLEDGKLRLKRSKENIKNIIDNCLD